MACDIVGDSLEPYAHDGDVALIHLTGEVRPGDIAAVLTPIGLLLKRVVLVGYWARLESVNPQALPIWFNAQDIVIQGRVIRTEHDW